MFSLYSDLPAPKNSVGGSSAPSTPAPNSSKSTPNTPATPATIIPDTTPKPTLDKQTPQTTPTATPSPSTGWNSKFGITNEKGVNMSHAFAQSVMLKKKRMEQQKTPTSTPRSSGASSIKSHSQDQEQTPSSHHSNVSRESAEDVMPERPKAVSIFAKEGEIIHEMYDPVVPNDYEEYLIERQVTQERRRREEEEERQAEQRKKKSQQASGFHFNYQNPAPAPAPKRPLPSIDEDLSDEYAKFEAEAQFRSSPPPLVPPPPISTSPAPAANIDLNISGEEAWRRRAALTAQIHGSSPHPQDSAGPSSSTTPSGHNSNNNNNNNNNAHNNHGGGGRDRDKQDANKRGQQRSDSMTVAERMMKRMGWTEGQGLGASGQGMRNPLLAKKTKGRGPSSGVIIGDDHHAGGPPMKMAKVERTSRVILLRNMVGPGEVDEELEGETASECEKFGKVIRCSIHEEKGPGVPAAKAVRIFVQFAEPSSAGRALASLHGRFFAKRTVEATYFDEERFEAGDLAAWPDEI